MPVFIDYPNPFKPLPYLYEARLASHGIWNDKMLLLAGRRIKDVI